MQIIKQVLSFDEITKKYLQKTIDGFIVESTYIKRLDKHTICISTQVGCSIGCRFCASGSRNNNFSYQRSLTSVEIVEECCNIVRKIDLIAYPKQLTFAFMGEGEPFLNFNECVKAFHVLAAMKWSVPIQFSVSTSGIRPNLIRRLGKITFPVHLKLQVSLHGSNDNIRSQITPIIKPVFDIVAAVRAYREKCSRPVIWNYVMCAGINDKLEHAEQLVQLLGPGWHIKFTKLNLVANSPFCPPSQEQVERFCRILKKGGLSVTYSETNESNIQSGCGQLSYSGDCI